MSVVARLCAPANSRAARTVSSGSTAEVWVHKLASEKSDAAATKK